MQSQDYVTFFKDLLASYYQFTLDNAVYSTCLAITVWFVTALIYSFRVGSLQKQIKTQQKAHQDTQENLQAKHAQVELLQGDIADFERQLADSHQHGEGLQTKLDELSSQLTASILAMAAKPELGQQGLTVREGLEAEQLWQRYQGAVSQICERLQTEAQQLAELTQTNQANLAKLAEHESQLQAAQLSADSLKQQVVKLEVSLQEQAAAHASQFAEVAEKAKTDAAKLANLEQQLGQAQQKQSSFMTKSVVPEITKPAMVEIPTPISVSEPERAAPVMHESIKMESVLSKVATTVTAINSESASPTKVNVTEESTGGFGGRFKSMFSNAKQKIDKLDEKLGQRTPLPQDIEEPEEELVIPQSPVSVQEPVRQVTESVAVTQKAAGGFGGKLKGMFGNAKAKSNAALDAVEDQADVLVHRIEDNVETIIATEKQAAGDLGGKLKGMFGKAKAKSNAALDAAEDQAEALVHNLEDKVDNAIATEKKLAGNLGGKLKGMFGGKK